MLWEFVPGRPAKFLGEYPIPVELPVWECDIIVSAEVITLANE